MSHPSLQEPPGTWLALIRRVSRPAPDAAATSAATSVAEPLGVSLSGGGTSGGPWVASTDGFTAVLDGELHTRAAVEASLGLSPGAASPAAIALAAYRCWHESFTARLRGVFGLVIVDSHRREVLALRDTLGFFPLFYAVAEDGLALSNSIAALSGQVRSPVNRRALAEYLLHRWPHPDGTFFEDVHRVPAGTVLRFDPSGRRVETRRYWNPCPADGQPEWLTGDEVAAFGDLFTRAVDRSLGDGPAAIFLSGGLDSVSVAAVAADQCRRRGEAPPSALSLSFPDPQCNEADSQRAIAQSLGLPFTLWELERAAGPQGLLAAALETSAGFDTPLQNFWLPCYNSLAGEVQRHGCSTILTGGGGDEWLTVDPIYTADLLRTGRFGAALRLLLVYQRSYRVPTLPMMRNVLWNNGVRPIAHAYGRRLAQTVAPGMLARRRRRALSRTLAGLPAWFAPDAALRDEISSRAEDDAREGSLRSVEAPRRGFYVQQFQRFLDHPLLALEIEEDYATWRRFGWRKAQPFWDAELVDFLYRVPPEMLNANGANKGLVREMLHRRFPRLGFERQKKVVSIDFFRSSLLDQGLRAWERFGGTPALASLGIVDAGKADAAARDILTNRKAADVHRVWDLLNLEAWLRPRLGTAAS